MRVLSATADSLPWLDDFYKKCGYGGTVQGDDIVYYAYQANQPVGVVRLATENDTQVLRGMQVAADQQGQGVGWALLDRLSQNLSETCYCLPYQHLEAFYQQGGFQRIANNQFPDFLYRRLQEYLQRGMSVIAMRFH